MQDSNHALLRDVETHLNKVLSLDPDNNVAVAMLQKVRWPHLHAQELNVGCRLEIYIRRTRNSIPCSSRVTSRWIQRSGLQQHLH